MKSKDLKFNFRQALSDALNGNDSEKVFDVFEEYGNTIREEITADMKLYQQTQDANILAARGVRQLTSKEKEFYQAWMNSAETGDIKQAFTGIENAFPETTILSITESIKSEFPLLDAIDFVITPSLVTKVIKNGAKAARAEWGPITDEIKKEVNGAIDILDITLCKLTAWFPVAKDLFRGGMEWVDAYAREILVEASGNGFCYAAVKGDGKYSPIGMARDCSKEAAVVNGQYPMQEPIAIENLNVDTWCALFAVLAKDELKRPRKVEGVIVVANPIDYYCRILPKIAYRNQAGEWVYTVPMPITFIQDTNVDIGTAIIGIGKNMKMYAGYGGKDGAIGFDDSYNYLEDL
ncbi:MAG: hypothetical protein KBT46_08950 [Ruminococcus sp.]|nr:hypothetical protein [Candidatus Copronaster equi]